MYPSCSPESALCGSFIPKYVVITSQSFQHVDKIEDNEKYSEMYSEGTFFKGQEMNKYIHIFFFNFDNFLWELVYVNGPSKKLLLLNFNIKNLGFSLDWDPESVCNFHCGNTEICLKNIIYLLDPKQRHQFLFFVERFHQGYLRLFFNEDVEL